MQTDSGPDAGLIISSNPTITLTERIMLLTYELAVLLLFVCAGVVWAFISFPGSRATFLYSITLVQWMFAILFCALLFYAALWIMLRIFIKDSRVAVDIIALLISLTPIMFNASTGFHLIYSGEYEGEARVESLLWRMDKSDNPTETDEYRELESMQKTVNDEEAKIAIRHILARIRDRK